MKGTVIAVMFVIEINLIASRRKNKLNIAHMFHTFWPWKVDKGTVSASI